MKIAQIMKKPVISCGEQDSIEHCAELMDKYDIGFLPVLDGNLKLTGVVTDRDIVTRVVAKKKSLTATKAGHVMSRDLFTCHVEDDLAAVENRMSQARKGRVAVVDAGSHKCIGIVSLADLAQSDVSDGPRRVLQQVTRREAKAPQK